VLKRGIRKDLKAPKGHFRPVPVAGNCRQQLELKIIIKY